MDLSPNRSRSRIPHRLLIRIIVSPRTRNLLPRPNLPIQLPGHPPFILIGPVPIRTQLELLRRQQSRPQQNTRNHDIIRLTRGFHKRPLPLARVDDQRLVALFLNAVDVDALVQFDDGRGWGSEAFVVLFGGGRGVCYSFVGALERDVGGLDDGGDVFD